MEANNDENNPVEPGRCSKLTSWIRAQITWQRFSQTIILLISFLACSSVIAFGTSLELTKQNIIKNLNLSNETFDNTVALFFLFNAIGLFAGGWMGDKYSRKAFISTGLVSFGCFGLLMGALGYFAAIEYWLFVILISLCGVCKITAQTGFVSALINWFEPDTIGFVMGLLAASQLVGTLFGLMFFQQYNVYSNKIPVIWSYTTLSTASFALFNSLVVGLFFKSAPEEKEVAASSASLIPNENGQVISSHLLLRRSPTINQYNLASPINPWAVVKHPTVLIYSSVYFMLNVANLGEILSYSGNSLWPNEFKSQEIVTLGKIAQAIGAVLIGLLSDKIGRRRLIAVISLFAGAGLLLPLIAVQYGSAIFTVLYFGFSFCFGVPFGLIPTAFVADIAKNNEFREKKCASTIAGMIIGSGSIGMIVQLYVVTKITSVIVLSVILALAAIASIKAAYYEHHEIKSKRSLPGFSLQVVHNGPVSDSFLVTDTEESKQN